MHIASSYQVDNILEWVFDFFGSGELGQRENIRMVDVLKNPDKIQRREGVADSLQNQHIFRGNQFFEIHWAQLKWEVYTL